jgi:tetratricopeptide (TPR) repeat protein
MFANATDLTDGDAAYAERADLNKARMALELYQKSAEAQPTAEALWKAARAAWWVGDQTENNKEKLNLFTLGIDLAKKGIAADAASVESHFWLGANYGSFGETKGVLKSLFLVKPIRHEMNDVVRINPTYEGGAGQRVLGVIDYKVPPVAGGNKKRAEDRLLSAYAIDPKNPYTVYYLGEYYHTMGNKEKAGTYLKSLETLEVSPEHGPDLAVMQKKAAALLSSF